VVNFLSNNTQLVPATAKVKRRRKLRFLRTRARELKMIGKALLSTKHPVLVHIIPMRRCNLDCGYCNEYDQVSKPVPLEEMKRRLDYLAAMGTSIITISGGEPLMHPDLEEVIRHIRKRGMIAGMITNGYLLTAERIHRLNKAGLDHLQISIDNVKPDDISKKSLKVLDKKLQLLSQHAVFHVNINSVVGGGIHNPQDAVAVGTRALELGFTSTIGIIHDGSGQLKPLQPEELQEMLRAVISACFMRTSAWAFSGDPLGRLSAAWRSALAVAWTRLSVSTRIPWPRSRTRVTSPSRR